MYEIISGSYQRAKERLPTLRPRFHLQLQIKWSILMRQSRCVSEWSKFQLSLSWQSAAGQNLGISEIYNFAQFSECYQSFRILINFQNDSQFFWGGFWPKFLNLPKTSKCCPNYILLPKRCSLALCSCCFFLVFSDPGAGLPSPGKAFLLGW